MSEGGSAAGAADRGRSVLPRASLPLAAALYALLFLALFHAAGLFGVETGISVWYPPAGVRLAVLLLFGWRFGLIVFAAEFVVGLFLPVMDFPWVWGGADGPSLGRAAGLLVSTAMPPLFYTLAAYVAGRRRLLDIGDEPVARIFWLCVLGVIAAALTAVSTCVTLAFHGFLPWSDVRTAAVAFMTGDLVGVLSFTPALYVVGTALIGRIRTQPPASRLRSRLIAIAETSNTDAAEKVLVEGIFCLAVAAVAMFSVADQGSLWQWYPLFLPIVWLALRFGLTGAVFGTTIVNTGVATLFAVSGTPTALQDVQVFMITLSVTGLLMGCVVSQLEEARADLDRRVTERTRDLTEEIRRRQAAEAVEAREKRRAESYLAIARTIIVALDVDARITLINNEGCTLLGYRRSTLLGQGWLDLVVPEDERTKVGYIHRKLMAGAEDPAKPFESAVLTRDGRRRLVDWRSSIVRSDDGEVDGVLIAGIDITERVAAEQEVRYLATHDPLTGLRNRHSLLDHFADAIARARRHDTLLAVLFADLDGFKRVNDAHGHAAGDRLLAEVGRRIASCVRATDTVTRFGGDEFVVVLEDLGNRQAASRLAQVIGERLSEPIDVGSGQIRIGTSIGVALFPDHGDTPETLLRAADAAMYEAKKTRNAAAAPAADPAKTAKQAASGA
jgi:diguanylate cyclase (GGDEF)-like protein/PAS domain S-box-containing protein